MRGSDPIRPQPNANSYIIGLEGEVRESVLCPAEEEEEEGVPEEGRRGEEEAREVRFR